MIEQHFGERADWSVGVEEEVMILDAETFAPVPAVDVLVRGGEARQLRGRLKTELHASIVELNTVECETAGEALNGLAVLREAAAEIAGEHGLAIAAAGAHPLVRPEELEIVQEPRYLEFVEYAGPSARRQGVSGLHVHVGMPSADACYHALEGVLPWLPVVLALSANSPFMAGADTEMMSSRAEVLAELPRSGSPPPFGSYGGWESFVERLAELGVAPDYTRFWWDLRPHPRFGTLEIRMPDQPTQLSLTGAFAALLQALCVVAVRSPARPPDAAGRGLYEQNRWAAARFGPRAELVHPDRSRLVAVPELAQELLDLVSPVAEELGAAGLLEALDPQRCEGDRQHEVGLESVCRDLVERTVG